MLRIPCLTFGHKVWHNTFSAFQPVRGKIVEFRYSGEFSSHGNACFVLINMMLSLLQKLTAPTFSVSDLNMFSFIHLDRSIVYSPHHVTVSRHTPQHNLYDLKIHARLL